MHSGTIAYVAIARHVPMIRRDMDMQAFAVLGNVMSLVGGMCSMCCSLLLPSLFYLILYKDELTCARQCGVVLLLLCGVALLLLIVVQNVQDLLRPLHAAITSKPLHSAIPALTGMIVLCTCACICNRHQVHVYMLQCVHVASIMLFSDLLCIGLTCILAAGNARVTNFAALQQSWPQSQA